MRLPVCCWSPFCYCFFVVFSFICGVWAQAVFFLICSPSFFASFATFGHRQCFSWFVPRRFSLLLRRLGTGRLFLDFYSLWAEALRTFFHEFFACAQNHPCGEKSREYYSTNEASVPNCYEKAGNQCDPDLYYFLLCPTPYSLPQETWNHKESLSFLNTKALHQSIESAG